MSQQLKSSEIRITSEELSMKKLKKLVKNERKKLIKLDEFSQRKFLQEVKKRWNSNKQIILELKTKYDKEWQQKQISWSEAKNPLAHVSFMKKANVMDLDDMNTQICPIKIICAVSRIPIVNTWIPTQKNIMAKSETMFFKFFDLGKNDHLENKSLFEELVESNDGKVHGKTDIMDDRLFVKLVKALMVHEKFVKPKSVSIKSRKKLKRDEKKEENQEYISCLKANIDDQNENKKETEKLPSMKLFEAIASAFPEEGDPNELYCRYSMLVKRSDPILKASKMALNVDDVVSSSVSAETALHSYHKLFCIQCYIYACPTHQLSKHPVPNLRKILGDDLIFTEPCGDECYRHLEDVKQKMVAMKMKKNKKKNKPNTSQTNQNQEVSNFSNFNQNINQASKSENNDHHQSNMISPFKMLRLYKSKKTKNTELPWSRSDSNIFNALLRPYRYNPCAIAKLMMNRSCQEVYKYAISIGYEMLQMKKKKVKVPQRRRINNNCMVAMPSISYNYEPCYHPDRNCDKNCHCIKHKTFCEKFCRCMSNCYNRFSGCKCTTLCNTNMCPCYKAERECDPDLCKTCGAHEFEINKITCKNICIQRNLHKHLLLGRSDVAGWGIFTKDFIAKNEFIYEYCGEIITHEEAERRGKIYDEIKCSYLFNLNKDYVIDATYIGNKIRFINHSDNPNCFAKILMVNGNHRIGFFANEAIQPGTELFFNYKYSKEHELQIFGEKYTNY